MILNNKEREALYELKQGKVDFVNFIFADTTLRVTREEEI